MKHNNRTEQVYQFVKAYLALNGFAPNIREIGHACKLSTSVVSYQLHILQDAGRLTVARNVARGIVLTEAAPDAGEDPTSGRNWPVLNKVAGR